MKKVLVSLCLLAVSVFAFSLVAEEPAAPVVLVGSADATPANLESLVPGQSEIRWVTSECSENCQLEFGWCLDGCDSWPYPGCYNDCRYIRHLCILECF